MPYVQDRVIHDADAHTMEPPEWLNEFAPKPLSNTSLNIFQKAVLNFSQTSSGAESYKPTKTFAKLLNKK